MYFCWDYEILKEIWESCGGKGNTVLSWIDLSLSEETELRDISSLLAFGFLGELHASNNNDSKNLPQSWKQQICRLQRQRKTPSCVHSRRWCSPAAYSWLLAHLDIGTSSTSNGSAYVKKNMSIVLKFFRIIYILGPFSNTTIIDKFISIIKYKELGFNI